MPQRETPDPLRDAGLALGLLTLVPTWVRRAPEGRTDTAGWFPAVGFGFGALAYGFALLWPMRSGQPYSLLPAILVVLLWALLSRLLHWDGLMDVADAWWGGATVERRLEIMKDSSVGAYGVAAAILCALTLTGAVHVVLNEGSGLPLLVAPVAGRLAATFAAWLGVPARGDGLGASVAGRPGPAAVLPALLALAATGAWVFSADGLAGTALLVGSAVGLALVVPHLVALRMGGVTGDVMGASVLLTETIFLTGWALYLGVA